MTRRGFLRLLAGGVLSLLYDPVRTLAARFGTGEPSNPTAVIPVSGMQPHVKRPKGAVPFITPNRKFYVEDIHGPPRSLDLKTWRLKITGKVDQPLTLSLDQIRKRPAIRQIITLSCIGNPVGGFALGNAEWEGISLRSLLDEADPDFFASTLIFKGADGYHDSVPLRRGRHRGALLVHTMNGEPLPLDHGYPLRVLIPGLYGIKQVKWITEIEVSNKSHTGYWQKQNWASDGKVKVISRIDFPRHGQRLRTARTTLRGIAFAGDRGIQYVQVSIDGERTWSLARLEKPPSSYSWVFWSLPVRFPKSGRYSIAVRAADQYSGVQFDGHRDPFPSGTSGIHRIQCRVHMVGR